MKEKISLKIILVILTIIILLGTSSLAVSESDLTQINNEIEETKNKLDNVEAEKSSTLTEISKLTAQISEYESQISDMQNEIDELESSIDKKTKEIAQKEEIYEENYDKMITRLVASYKNGNTTYLDVILSSKSITDLASNWYYLSIITEADMNFLETVQNAKIEIEQAKAQLEKDKEKIELNKKNIEQTSDALQKAQKQKKQEVVNLSDEEKKLQDELDQFEKDKKDIEKKLAEIAASEGNNVIPGTPSSHGYIFPVAGLSTANINNKTYPSYAGHTGVDVNINVLGKSVVAVKSGTVEISTALTGSIPNYDSNGNYIGSYRSYGEYIVINHHDGTMTLYGHLKPGSRRVSEGQTVQQGQVIATVGNTGNCMPRPTSSNPNNGTHLHFEVRINGRCVNPIPYLP